MLRGGKVQGTGRDINPWRLAGGSSPLYVGSHNKKLRLQGKRRTCGGRCGKNGVFEGRIKSRPKRIRLTVEGGEPGVIWFKAPCVLEGNCKVGFFPGFLGERPPG